MKRALIILSINLLLNSCYYGTPGSYSVAVSKSRAGATQDTRTARPTVRFPANLAIARIESSYSGYRLKRDTDVEQSKHAEAVTRLSGVRGIVNLNQVGLVTNLKDYAQLDQEARKLGADLLAVYRIEESVHSTDYLPILSFATLGLAPTKPYRLSATASLMVRDARTGYVYGVLEEKAEASGIMAEMDTYNNQSRAMRKAKTEALDKLADQLPVFWDMVRSKGR